MRRALHALVVVAVGAAALALPAAPAAAIDPPTVRVTPGVSSVLTGATRQLAATVQNLTDTTVTWSVRSGGGTVGTDGLYTPPAQVPATPVAVVRATAVEDPSVFGEATIAIASGVAGGTFGAEIPLGAGGGQDADMGDVTGDGKADIVLLQNCCNSLRVWNFVILSWNGTGFTKTVTEAGSTYDGFTATNDHVLDHELGDVDGDGDLDIYVPFGSAQAQTWRYQVWRNNGTGTFTPDAKVRTIGGARAGARGRLTDFDGDGHLDAVRLEWFGTMLLERGNGNGTFQEPVALMSTFDADSFDIGDLTGDGRPDIAVGIKGMSNSSTTIEVGINNGFGGISSEVTYNVGMAPEPRIADTDGDGWNDLVVGIGGEQYTYFPPRLMAFKNLATGTGAVATTGVQLLDWRPRGLDAVHVDGDGVLDLAGYTYRGPVMLRKTAPNAYAAVHAATLGSIHHATYGDADGDGRLDVFTNFDGSSQYWPGAADAPMSFSVAPTVTRVNATHTAPFTAVLRNTPVEPKTTWSATRGSFNEATYTAPATASPSGTPVTVTATLTGTTSTATRAITIVNDKFQFTSLGGLQVRHVVADPQQPTHLYAATSNGVFRSTSNGVSFAPLGPTTTTGVDARQVAVLREPGGALRVLAIFGTTLYRINVDGGDWMHASAPANATSVSVAPHTPVAFVAAGGTVVRSIDGGSGWTSLGQTSVTRVEAIDPSNVWLVRSAAPRVSRGTVVTTPALGLDVTARELPVPGATVNAIAVHPTNRTLAYVATNDATNPLFRDAGGNGDAGSPMWAATPTPGIVDRLSVSPSGVVLAARSGTLELHKSTDEGAAWHSINRGFANVSAQSVAHRGDGLDLVGTSGGLYTPVESAPPAAPSVTGGPTGTTGPGAANSFSFTFDAVADAASYVCALDDKAWAACTSPKAYSGPLASGSHTFSVVAVDANGNESAPGTRSWTVDATPAPVPTILTGPSGTVASSSAAFTFELTGDATGATCSLDNATPVACVSGVSYSALSQGAHTFAARSVDAAGNVSAPATRSWTVDTVPPQFPHWYQTPYWVSSTNSAFFQWQSDPSASYVCRLDGAVTPCSMSAASLSGLSEGTHVFRVTASDGAGNSTSNEYSWRVDLTDPGAPVITVKPDASTAAATARFEFASPSDDVSYYWCTLDGQGQYCYGTVDYAGLSAGTHAFSVQAVDDAGRQSPLAQYSWVVAVPAPVISGGPSGLVGTRTASFTFTAVEGATTACSLDGATPAPCSSGVTYNGLADGPHTFSVTATKNGATSAAATREWTVDATVPGAPELTTVPPKRTTAAVATFGWTPDPALTYTCALDGSPVTCGTGSYQATEVTEGAHEFVLTARDAALNAATATYAWTVDRTGPAVSVSAKPDPRTKATTARFEFGSGASDVHHFVCTVDGTASTCPSPLDLSSLAEGEHTFSVVAYDDLGNAGDAVAHTWTVDTTGPVVSLTAKPAALTNATSATFEFDTVESFKRFACTLDGVTDHTCESPRALADLAPGEHTFSVVGYDDLGNAGAPVTHTWTIDSSAPTATIARPSASLSPAHTVSFDEPVRGVDAAAVRLLVTGTTSAVPSAVTCRTAAGAVVACTADTVRKAVLAPVGPLVPGQLYTVSVSGVTDLAGNAAAAATAAYRASVSEQESGLASKPAWRKVTASTAQGGSYHVSDAKSATASYAFTGTSVTWYGVRGPSFGLADVYVDNVLKASKVNFYSSAGGALSRTVSGLSNAKHTLRIVVRGERGSTSGTGTNVAVDAFKVGSTVAATPGVAWTWGRTATSAASGGAYAVDDAAGATFSITFRGRGIDWVTVLGPNMGKATVHVDGVSKGTFDNYASATKYGHVRRFGGLTDTVHTLKITVLGQRRSGATGTNVAVDRFGILA